jgi:hypothetical protein
MSGSHTSVLRRLLRDLVHDRRGSSLTAFVAGLGMVCASVACAIDFGNALTEKAKLQGAIDAAVIAGALDSGTNWETRALGTLKAPYDAAVGETIVYDFDKSVTQVVTGTASLDVPTFFGGILGISEVTVAADAIAKGGSSEKVCILVKSTTANQSLLVNSGATVTAPTCRIDVASTANPAAIFNSGSNLSFKKICIAGSKIIDNGGTHPNLEKSCTTVTDPFAGAMPAVPSTACTVNGTNYNSGPVNLTPGVYCGWFNFNSAFTVNFAPGLYVIKSGGWNVNGGTWNGNGVTFYFADNSKIQFNSAVKTYMSAPTSGTYSGILLYEASGLSKSQFVWNNSAGHTVNGLIYLPSRDMTFNAGADVISDSITMVVNTLILNSMNWKFGPSDKTISAAGGGSGGGTVFLSQ